MKNNKTAIQSTGIYVRVSTEEQVQEGFSIRAQTEKLKAYALLKEWDIYDIYADEGISGKNIVDRPAVNRLIDDINDGKVNNVLVFKVDRITRSTKNLLELVELFEDCNCTFNSLTESIDTDTPSGRMFLKIIGIFAEFERENLASRLKLGFERKVKEGYTLATGHISYGYIKEKGQKIQTIQRDEARVVQEIFSMFMDKNMSMNRIAKILNERKLPTKGNSNSWKGTTIRKILTNPTYIGKVRYSTADKSKYFEVEGQHERIVSDELYQLVQEKLNHMPNILKTKRPKEENYFCGVLTCGMCGRKFSTHNFRKSKEGKLVRSYKCMNKIYYNNAITCKSPQIIHEKVEQAFIEYIQNINDFTTTDNTNEEDTIKKQEQELLEHIVNLEKKLSTLQERKRQIGEQYINANIEFDEYKNLTNTMNERYMAVEIELDHKKTELTNLTSTPKILPEDVILNLRENWEYLNNNEKMMFLQRFVKKITITVEKERKNSNIVKIDGIEFHSGELQTREKVRSKLAKPKSLVR